MYSEIQEKVDSPRWVDRPLFTSHRHQHIPLSGKAKYHFGNFITNRQGRPSLFA